MERGSRLDLRGGRNSTDCSMRDRCASDATRRAVVPQRVIGRTRQRASPATATATSPRSRERPLTGVRRSIQRQAPTAGRGRLRRRASAIGLAGVEARRARGGRARPTLERSLDAAVDPMPTFQSPGSGDQNSMKRTSTLHRMPNGRGYWQTVPGSAKTCRAIGLDPETPFTV